MTLNNPNGFFNNSIEFKSLRNGLMRLRGDLKRAPDASVIIPVNAQADLQSVITILDDITCYKGKYRLEIILVINNYPDNAAPAEINLFQQLGVEVVAVPSARKHGEVVILSARALGVEAAKSDVTIHFDADCKIVDVNALIDWYVKTINSGVSLAYSHVGYYDLRKVPSIYVKIALHHAVRWIKRNLVGIPTTRGSNYAIDKKVFSDLYLNNILSVDLQVGPAVKLEGKEIAYSGNPKLRVLTSGRRFRGGWVKLLRYFHYRLQYNIRAIPTRKNEAARENWDGFDRESEQRKILALPNEEKNSD